jgi:hypothetical protein
MSIGRSLVTVAWGFKKGLFDAATTALENDPTYVCVGSPGSTEPNEIASIGLIRTSQQPATYGSNREREEVMLCDVTISVYSGGGEEAQQLVSSRAWEILGLIEKQVHFVVGGVDGTLLGGVVRECFLTDAVEDSAAVQVDASIGRESVIIATFTGKARVTWAP